MARPVRFPAVRQRWRTVSFLHWPVEPSVVARLLPHGLEPDLWDDTAWIGLTPFTTTCEVLAARALPGPERFPETNLRTYVQASDGTSGIWFLSLDVTNRSNAWLGRAARVPYFEADMSVDRETDDDALPAVRYRSQRRGRPDVGYDVTVATSPDAADGPFERYLTDRASAYVTVGPVLMRVDVEHEPWPLQHARAVRVDETLTVAADIARPPGLPPVVHHASGVDARLAWPRPVLV